MRKQPKTIGHNLTEDIFTLSESYVLETATLSFSEKIIFFNGKEISNHNLPDLMLLSLPVEISPTVAISITKSLMMMPPNSVLIFLPFATEKTYGIVNNLITIPAVYSIHVADWMVRNTAFPSVICKKFLELNGCRK